MSDTKTKRARILYWVTTGLAVAALAASGAADLAQNPKMIAGLAVLGYPAYVATLLGVWKLLAVPALLTTRFPRLREWAYAGVFFDLTGAAFSHLASGDAPANAVAPLILLGLAMTSWALTGARGAATGTGRAPALVVA